MRLSLLKIIYIVLMFEISIIIHCLYDFDRIMQLKKKCKKSVGEKVDGKLDDMLDENSNDIIVCFL